MIRPKKGWNGAVYKVAQVPIFFLAHLGVEHAHHDVCPGLGDPLCQMVVVLVVKLTAKLITCKIVAPYMVPPVKEALGSCVFPSATINPTPQPPTNMEVHRPL